MMKLTTEAQYIMYIYFKAIFFKMF